MYSRKCSLCLSQGESLFKITTTHLKWVLSAARQSSHICSVNSFLWALKRPHYIFSLYPQMLFTSPHFLLTGEESNQTKCLSQLPITMYQHLCSYSLPLLAYNTGKESLCYKQGHLLYNSQNISVFVPVMSKSPKIPSPRRLLNIE